MQTTTVDAAEFEDELHDILELEPTHLVMNWSKDRTEVSIDWR